MIGIHVRYQLDKNGWISTAKRRCRSKPPCAKWIGFARARQRHVNRRRGHRRGRQKLEAIGNFILDIDEILLGQCPVLAGNQDW